jgi:monoamine oxidase
MNSNFQIILFKNNKKKKKLKSFIRENLANDYFKKLLSDHFNKDIKITNVKKFFWEEGTHYYKPLIGYKSRKEFIKDAQHPKNNIWVVGEVVAERQGWVEGALSSVEKISLFKK